MSTKISVCVSTYNQEKYIQDCIKSILNQTYQDFEIIINDDCSSDKTLDKISEIKDERIKVIDCKYNKGINAGLNNLIEKASGEYLVFIAGDDMFKPFYFKKFVDYMDNNRDIDVLYCKKTHIKDKFTLDTIDKKFFNEKTNEVTRNDLKVMFHKAILMGNVAVSPGMVIKNSTAKKIFPLPCSLVNFQDVVIHFKLMISGAKSAVLHDEVLFYRINPGNVSRQGFLSRLRTDLETECLMDTFLNMQDVELLEAAFEKEIKQTGIKPYKDTIPYFLGRMAILSEKHARVSWGYHKIVEFLADGKNFDLIKERYNLEFKDFLKLPKAARDSIFLKTFRYKKYFNYCLVALIICGCLMTVFGIALLFMLLH